MQFNLKEKLVYSLSMLLTRFLNRGKNLEHFIPKNILVVKLDEIGDLCYALHVFDLLKMRYPNATITVLCKPFAASLLEANPAIGQIIHQVSEVPSQTDLWIELRGNFKSILKAIQRLPKVRLDRGTVRFKNKLQGGHPHEIVTNQQIIEPLLLTNHAQQYPVLNVSEAASAKVQEYLLTNKIQQYAVIHPGARKALRRWNASNFAALADWLSMNHQLQVVFVGDPSEISLVETIQTKCKSKVYSAAGIGDLTFLSALLAKSQLFVGNESGPLCIASVSSIPCLGLFGPGEPHVFYPIGEKATVIHHLLPCNPCSQNICIRPQQTCMDFITLIEVQEKINQLLVQFN